LLRTTIPFKELAIADYFLIEKADFSNVLYFRTNFMLKKMLSKMKDKHKDQQNNSGISATAGKLLFCFDRIGGTCLLFVFGG